MGVRILDDVRLVWDRLPMTIVFMSLLAALVAERINVRVGVWLMPFLLFIGVASVLQWRVSELRAAGDLRFYAAVQLYYILFLLIALLLPSRYTRGRDLKTVAGFYVLARILEAPDRPIFELGHIVSGHTLILGLSCDELGLVAHGWKRSSRTVTQKGCEESYGGSDSRLESRPATRT
jgi:hypothetical protein